LSSHRFSPWLKLNEIDWLSEGDSWRKRNFMSSPGSLMYTA
jgi:hypothetical protein